MLDNADWFGAITAGPAIAMLAIAVDQGDRLDWFNSGLITGLFSAGSCLLVIFLVNELREPNPLYNLALLRRVNFAIPVLVLIAFRFALLASASITPQYLSRIQSLRPLQSSDVLSLVALPQLILPACVVLALRWIDGRLVMGFGLIAMAVGCLLNLGITSQWAYTEFIVPAVVQGVAEPVIIIPLLVLAIEQIKSNEANWAGAMVNELRSFGGTLGGGLVTTILRHREQYHSNVLTQDVIAGSYKTVDRLDALSSGTLPSLRALSGTVRGQAYVMSYADGFAVLAIIMLAMTVLTALMQPPAPPGTPPGAS